MSFSIIPDHKLGEFQGNLTLDHKIDVFISRVNGWMINPAIEMLYKNTGLYISQTLHDIAYL